MKNEKKQGDVKEFSKKLWTSIKIETFKLKQKQASWLSEQIKTETLGIVTVTILWYESIPRN